ncbi:DUF1839 family protein [Kocuria rhizophila]|nr:DUF1839 family protein [Kocuria rhizophila]
MAAHAAELPALAGRGMDYFHVYSFATTRQAGLTAGSPPTRAATSPRERSSGRAGPRRPAAAGRRGVPGRGRGRRQDPQFQLARAAHAPQGGRVRAGLRLRLRHRDGERAGRRGRRVMPAAQDVLARATWTLRRE